VEAAARNSVARIEGFMRVPFLRCVGYVLRAMFAAMGLRSFRHG